VRKKMPNRPFKRVEKEKADFFGGKVLSTTVLVRFEGENHPICLCFGRQKQKSERQNTREVNEAL
jgi:hypothetical protein